MILNAQSIAQLEKKQRILLMNSITGVKPANLIATSDAHGNTNVAIFSSVVHLGSDPALIGFVLRPKSQVRRHTHENIMATGHYTINQVHEDLVAQAHLSSAKLPKEQSEFDLCQLKPQFLDDFSAPFVSEAKVKYGLDFVEEIPITHNQTSLMVGEIKHIVLEDCNQVPTDGLLLDQLQSAGLSGFNDYYSLQHLATLNQVDH